MEFNIDKQDDPKTDVDENMDQSSSQDGNPNFPAFNEGSWIFASIGGYFTPAENLSKLSASRQEQLLVRDLIYSFSGVPSTHIIPDIRADQLASLTPEEMTKIRFKIHDGFSSVFRPITNELMPLIAHYISIQSFIDETNMDRNCIPARTALANSMEEILEQYHDLQSNLDTELNEKKLDLQKLVQQIRPWLPTMLLFSTIANDVRRLSLNSAQVLSMLEDLYQVLKPTQSKELAERLAKMVEEISSNYMNMVQIWTQKGIVYDLVEEFFIEDTEPTNAMSRILLGPEQCCNSYWDQRYRLHTDRLPNFLLPYAEKIFLSGKYLNILRQCNVPIKLMDTALSYNPLNLAHVEIIVSSYELPAKKLMDFLLTEHNLLRQVHNLRCFGLLQNITFANDLMAKSQNYLKHRIYNLQLNEMEMVFGKVLRSLEDSFGDLLHIQIKDCEVVAQFAKSIRLDNDDANDSKDEDSSDPAEYFNLYGYEAVALRYEPFWPVSLVITPRRSEQVQILQRILFFLRYVECQLVSFGGASLEPIRSNTLRQRMLKTMCSLEQYMAVDVIENRWVDLLRAVNRASHIDDVLSAINSALDQCMLLCLFNEVSYVRAIFTLGSVCLNYCDCLSNDDTPSIHDFDLSVTEYEENFDSILLCILNLLRELAKTGGNTNENLRESAKKLLLRLENVETDDEPNGIIPLQSYQSTFDPKL